MIQNPLCTNCHADLQSDGYELHAVNGGPINGTSLVICANCRTTYVVINMVLLGNLVTYLQPINLHPVPKRLISEGLDKHLEKLGRTPKGQLEQFTIQGLSDKDVDSLKGVINKAETVNQFLDSIKQSKNDKSE